MDSAKKIETTQTEPCADRKTQHIARREIFKINIEIKRFNEDVHFATAIINGKIFETITVFSYFKYSLSEKIMIDFKRFGQEFVVNATVTGTKDFSLISAGKISESANLIRPKQVTTVRLEFKDQAESSKFMQFF
jgi:hypothetical protein